MATPPTHCQIKMERRKGEGSWLRRGWLRQGSLRHWRKTWTNNRRRKRNQNQSSQTKTPWNKRGSRSDLVWFRFRANTGSTGLIYQLYHKQGPHADLHPEIQLHHEVQASRVKSPYEEQQEQQRLEAQRAEERRQIQMHQEALRAQRERVLREREQKLKEEREKEEQQHREADRQEQLLREEQQRSDGVTTGRNRLTL